MKDYEERVAAETNEVINREIRTQRINGQPIAGTFSSHVERDDDGDTTTNVTIIGRTNRDYNFIAWMEKYMQIYYSVLAQVRLKFVPINCTIKAWPDHMCQLVVDPTVLYTRYAVLSNVPCHTATEFLKILIHRFLYSSSLAGHA